VCLSYTDIKCMLQLSALSNQVAIQQYLHEVYPWVSYYCGDLYIYWADRSTDKAQVTNSHKPHMSTITNNLLQKSK